MYGIKAKILELELEKKWQYKSSKFKGRDSIKDADEVWIYDPE